jgi:hypothetical protein
MMASSCCAAMELGSDSARVNEVAKLCRAVAHGTKDRWSSEGSACGFDPRCGRPKIGPADTRAAVVPVSSISNPAVRVFITVCDGLDQAFKGIWWMPWH